MGAAGLGSPWMCVLCGFGVLVGLVRCAIDLWGPCGCVMVHGCGGQE